MSITTKPIEYFWKINNFNPTSSQIDAILHVEGPLFLTAGPGSGKTRVLLWRTLNLLVYQNVKPEEIFLSTFTEKAALQLKEGLKSLLAIVTNDTGKPYDLSLMSLGTVHSICNSILKDRRFSPAGKRNHPPVVIDALGQYFRIYNKRYWNELIKAGEFNDEETAQRSINNYLANWDSSSRHNAVVNCISLFNRFSEECINPEEFKTINWDLNALINMYDYYKSSLKESDYVEIADLSLLQQKAYDTIKKFSDSKKIFKHIIIDEYQDTNPIQEKIFFALAEGHKNICVVGDDDQALYRFRGATVENLVEFDNHCKTFLKVKPSRIDLVTNFRSKKNIVSLYIDFIQRADWKKPKGQKGHFRIHDKKIISNSNDKEISVLVSQKADRTVVYEEIALFIKKLHTEKKISDYNQVAFLFPSMKSRGEIGSRVKGFMEAFDKNEVPYYAPRAGRFLDTEESIAVFGLFLKVFGRPHYDAASGGLINFRNWMFNCEGVASKLLKDDPLLDTYITDRKKELETNLNDYNSLLTFAAKKRYDIKSPCLHAIAQELSKISGISQRTIKSLSGFFFLQILEKRIKEKRPLTIEYVINRATSVDWTVLDLFYQLLGFGHFRNMIELAENSVDEGPICNLGLITQYLDRFMEQYPSVITAKFLDQNRFINSFFTSFLYALYRLQESEYEDAEDPFPKGRVSFLTIHQAKGLEFPVVVLGSIYKEDRPPSKNEQIIRELIPNKDAEPLEKISEFDKMRMFYVALSRAKNLLIIPRYTRGKASCFPFKEMFESLDFTEIKDFKSKSFAPVKFEKEDIGKTYSYTGDYLSYIKCHRNYMFFKKYGFVPSRTQTMFFGSLVHQTIEDLHYFLIDQKRKTSAT